jgi:hypothetical protein
VLPQANRPAAASAIDSFDRSRLIWITNTPALHKGWKQSKRKQHNDF